MEEQHSRDRIRQEFGANSSNQRHMHQVASGLNKRDTNRDTRTLRKGPSGSSKQSVRARQAARRRPGAASKASGLNKQHAGDRKQQTSVRAQQAECRRPGDRNNKKGVRGLDKQQGHEQGYSHAQAGSKWEQHTVGQGSTSSTQDKNN